MPLRVLSLIAVLTVSAALADAGQGSNLPWFPSLMAFEHYNSGRSHLFAAGDLWWRVLGTQHRHHAEGEYDLPIPMECYLFGRQERLSLRRRLRQRSVLHRRLRCQDRSGEPRTDLVHS